MQSAPVVVNGETRKNLVQTAKWAKIVAIISFISCGFIVLAGLAIFIVGLINPLFPVPQNLGQAQWLFGLLYLFIGVVTFIMTLFLYRFSTGVPKAFENDDVPALNKAIANHMRYYKFSVILTIVMVGLMIIGLIIAALSVSL